MCYLSRSCSLTYQDETVRCFMFYYSSGSYNEKLERDQSSPVRLAAGQAQLAACYLLTNKHY